MMPQKERTLNMKMKKWMNKAVMLLMVCLLMAGMSVTAFAQGGEVVPLGNPVLEEQFSGEEISTETEAPTEEEEMQEEAPAEDNRSDDAFSVDGNGTVLDNMTDHKSGKEFYTIQTANNNTYFIIIDHASTTQNVYMLSMIDENDLKEFLTEEEKPQQQTPTVVIPEEKPEPKPEVEVQPTQPAKTNNMGTLVILLVIGGAIAGGYYYFKIYKPKKDGAFSDDEDLEYMDDGVTVNEDSAENAAAGGADGDNGYYLDEDDD